MTNTYEMVEVKKQAPNKEPQFFYYLQVNGQAVGSWKSSKKEVEEALNNLVARSQEITSTYVIKRFVIPEPNAEPVQNKHILLTCVCGAVSHILPPTKETPARYTECTCGKQFMLVETT